MARRFGAESISLLDSSRRKKHHTAGTGLIISPTHLSAIDLEDFLPQTVDNKFAVVRDPLKRIISEYKFQAGHSASTKFSFSTWLRIMLFSASKESRIYDNHIRPQVDLLPEATEIFRLEDGFDGMISWLDEKTGTQRDDLTVGHFLKKTPKQEIKPSKQDIELIIDYYAEDYERLGYDKPNPENFKSGNFELFRCVFAKVLMHPFLIKHKLQWLK